MAQDNVEVMRALGFDRFAVAGHDRGARVAWRIAVEHPDRVTRLAVIDIVPKPYSTVTRAFATAYFHWFFLIQPAPLPETLIGSNAEFWLRSRFLAGSAFTPAALAEYLRCFKDPAAIHATCEDYRAGASIDLAHSDEDKGRRIACPTLVLWGERGTVGRLYDVMQVWRDYASDVRGMPLPGGHFLPEELPDATLDALVSHFGVS
jgi:haloacetate dehalogenase